MPPGWARADCGRQSPGSCKGNKGQGHAQHQNVGHQRIQALSQSGTPLSVSHAPHYDPLHLHFSSLEGLRSCSLPPTAPPGSSRSAAARRPLRFTALPPAPPHLCVSLQPGNLPTRVSNHTLFQPQGPRHRREQRSPISLTCVYPPVRKAPPLKATSPSLPAMSQSNQIPSGRKEAEIRHPAPRLPACRSRPARPVSIQNDTPRAWVRMASPPFLPPPQLDKTET